MTTKLTKDAQKLAAIVYKDYLECRKSGMSKGDAAMFSPDELRAKYFPKENLSDVYDTVDELCHAYGCKQYIDGTFVLSTSFIIYMENRFKNGVADVLSFLAQFIP